MIFTGRKRSEKIKATFANGNDGWQLGKRHQAFTHFRCVLGRMVRMNTGGGKNPPRALISQPTVLLLDEPLGSLDYNLRQSMIVELKRVQRELSMTFMMVTHSQEEAMSMADKVIVMSDAVIQQTGTSREIYESPRTRFVAGFIGNNNLFKGTIKSRSGSMVFVEVEDQLIYVRVPEYLRQVQVGKEAHFSVRADVMHTGEHPDMANRVTGRYITTEFRGSLETDVFEIAPNHFIHVEQHRSASDRMYDMGEAEIICWPAEAGVLLDQKF